MAKNQPRKGLRRRDATGHLDPQYAEELLEQSRANRSSDPPAAAFVDDSDDLATPLAEDFVQAATSAEDGDEDAGDELIRVEPFVPDGDDDDLAFEPEELLFPPKSHRTRAEAPAAARPAKRAVKAQPKAAKSRAKVTQTKAVASKASKGKTAKAKAAPSKASKAKAATPKAGKAKATASKATKATKGRPARKVAKRKR